MNDYQLNQMLGQREPRSKLLPPYLAVNPYFKEFADALDRVWATKVDNKLEVLKYIRNMWVTNPTVEQKIVDQQLIDLEDWTRPERQLLVRQVNLLGMKLKSAGLLTDQNYLTVSRFLGRYWFGKGTEAFIQFINFALILDLEVNKLWAERLPGLENQYSNFTREPSPGQPPGLPIWEGGTWFPTTHVEIVANKGLGEVDQTTLAEFFYEIANYNLVLSSVDASYNLPVVPIGETTTKVAAAGLVLDNVIVCSTEGRTGAVAPPSTNIHGVPTQTWGASSVILGKPSAWTADSEGRKFPVYNRGIVESTADDLPTSVYDAPAVNPIGTSYILGYPEQWVDLPGTPRTGGKIPGWSVAPVATDDGVVPTRIFGARTILLSNPKGFVELNGSYVPYW